MRRARQPLVAGLVLLLAFAGVGGATAQDATVTFVDGWVDIRTETGRTFPADFGDELGAGDRVTTGRVGEAELELESGGVVSVAPDTVFIIGSTTDVEGRRTSRLAAAVGTFSFRFNALVGTEPSVGSTTSAAGVRGTEVRVYAASDGTTRYEVVAGLVEIEDRGERIALGPEQAVEITPGRGANSVFNFLQRPIDYSVWNAGLVDGFLDDPVASFRGVAGEMSEIIHEVERRGPRVDALFEEFYRERDRLDEIEEAEGADARVKHFSEVVTPLRQTAREAYTEFRFIVLSALSLDQYVISRLAAEMEAAYFFDRDADPYAAFQGELAALRDEYERVVAPRLSPTDL
jgi:hypothetical protein